jgi:putative transposase
MVYDDASVEQVLTGLFPSAWIETQARVLGVVQRMRKIDPSALFWTLVLGFGTGAHRSMGSLRRAFCQAVGMQVARSSFYDRFTPQLVGLLQAGVVLASEALVGAHLSQEGLLELFRDVVIADGTVLRLWDLLKDTFPACAEGRAAAKLHVVLSVFGHTATQIKLTSQRPNEGKLLSIGPWVQGRLLLIDLGFFGFRLFDRIDRNKGFFISRLKNTANPLIVDVYQTWRGNAIPLVGKRIQDVVNALHRQILDVQVQVNVQRRKYRGRCRTIKRTFRLVGIRHPQTGEYHLYLTNIPSPLVSARQIQALYSARWLVELLFDQLKTQYRIEELPSHQPYVVQALIYASLLTWMADQRMTQALGEQMNAASRRQAAVLAAFGPKLLEAVIKHLGGYQGTCSLTQLIQAELRDPNRNRQLLLQRAGFT